MTIAFSEVITTEAELREVMGYPSPKIAAKIIPSLDAHCRSWIAKSPFILVASADAQGNVDISPKGDPAGFVQVLDDNTLAIPDRVGNRIADTFTNILQDSHVGLIFLIPGRRETLRVSGKAMLVRDAWLRERMSIEGKTPDFALVVTVEKALFHCGKCVIRSNIWDSAGWPDSEGLPSLARAIVDQAKLSDSVDDMQAQIEQSYRDRLY